MLGKLTDYIRIIFFLLFFGLGSCFEFNFIICFYRKNKESSWQNKIACFRSCDGCTEKTDYTPVVRNNINTVAPEDDSNGLTKNKISYRNKYVNSFILNLSPEYFFFFFLPHKPNLWPVKCIWVMFLFLYSNWYLFMLTYHSVYLKQLIFAEK